MDLFDRFAGNDSWHMRRLLEYASTLTEEQLDRPLPTVVELLPWRQSNKTLRQLLKNIIFTKEVWSAALSGDEMDMNGPPIIAFSKAMLQRLEKTDANCIVFGGMSETAPRGMTLLSTRSASRPRPSRSAVSSPIS